MNRQDLRKEFDLLHVPRAIYNLNGESFPEKTTISGLGSNWTVHRQNVFKKKYGQFPAFYTT
jgi:hypothetical protein